MSKWRPSEQCLYVIPDIHGQYYQLELILSRILPLRTINGIKDQIVFLGDYIDRGKYSPQVVDRIIDLKLEYPDQIITIRGNHELMIMNAIKPSKTSDDYILWMKNGGLETLSSYLDLSDQHMDNPYELLRSRIHDFIPKKHKDFFTGLDYYYETDDFIFVHGGCDPLLPLEEHSKQFMSWDRSLFQFVSNLVEISKRDNIELQLNWEKCIITGHNGSKRQEPLICPKFMMLDCSGIGKLIVLEVNSMEGFYAKKGKKRLVKLNF
jgi:serine/threonine protein phosphatase 1